MRESIATGTSSRADSRADGDRCQLEADRANRTTKMLAAALYEKGIDDVLINDPAQATETLRMANEAGYSPSHVLVLDGLWRSMAATTMVPYSVRRSAGTRTPTTSPPASLLSVAYVWSGQDDLGELELQDLRDLEPTSNADRLLMAYAFMSADPHKAKQLLDSAEGIRRSPLGLLIGGFLKLFDAWEHEDAMLADQAIRDFEYVQFLFNDNQASLGFRILALAAGIRFARANGKEEVAERYKQEGLIVAKQLAMAANYPAGDWSRQQFYLTIGEADEAWEAIRGVGRHPGPIPGFSRRIALSDTVLMHSMNSTRQSAQSTETANMYEWPGLTFCWSRPTMPRRWKVSSRICSTTSLRFFAAMRYFLCASLVSVTKSETTRWRSPRWSKACGTMQSV